MNQNQQKKIQNLEKKLEEAGFSLKYRKFGELKLQKCPHHKDRTGSLSINVLKDKFKCFSCSDSGNLSKLLSYYGIKWGWFNQAPTIDELEQLLNETSSEKIAEINEQEYRGNLSELKEYRKWYHPYLESRGFNKEFCIKNKIGFDKESIRVTIPIFFFGNYYGCIRRSVVPDEIPKVIYDSGLQKDKIVYLPLTNTGNSDKLVIVEGAFDALKVSLYNQDVCSILGCHASADQINLINRIANGRTIVLALDNDTPGHDGMMNYFKDADSFDNLEVFNYNGTALKDPCDLPESNIIYGIKNAKSILEYF